MSGPADAIRQAALADIRAIIATDGPVLQRFQAIEDRLARADEALAYLPTADRPIDLVPTPFCECGEADCRRGLCTDGPEAA